MIDWSCEHRSATFPSRRKKQHLGKPQKKTIKIGSEKRREKKSKVETDRNAQASGLGFLLFLFIAPIICTKKCPANIFTAAQTHQTLSHSREFEARSLISRVGEITGQEEAEAAPQFGRLSRAAIHFRSFRARARLMRLIQQRFTYKLELRN